MHQIPAISNPDSNKPRARSYRRLIEVGVALGEVVRRKEGAGHNPDVGDLLPLGRLICERARHNEQTQMRSRSGPAERERERGRGGGARTGVVVGGGHAAPRWGRGLGTRRQRPEAGSHRRRSHGWWCRWFGGNGVGVADLVLVGAQTYFIGSAGPRSLGLS
jgi:hypothetical protein